MNTNRPEFPQGWPDVQTLERLANEYFSAVPGSIPREAPLSSVPQDLGGSVPLAGSVPSTVAIPSLVSIPGESELQALLAAIPGACAQVAQAAVYPAYYFLENTPLSPAGIRVPGFESRTPEPSTPGASFDVNQVRRDFPILQERVNGRPLVWLDNAATTQKPQQVIDRIKYFYEHENSNIHRAAHGLAARSTDAYEGAREKVRAFLNASSVKEIVFTRGATEAINLVAQSWGRQNIGKDDEINGW